MAIKTPHRIATQGSGVGNIPVTFGNRIFCDKNGNGGDGSSIDSPFTNIAIAYAAAVSSNDDQILLSSNSTHSLSAVLDVSKNQVHFEGCDGTLRRYGNGSRVSIGVTTDTDDIAPVKVTGVRNSFKNMKISSSNTLTEGVYAFADGGEYTVLDHVELYLSSQLTVTGAAELLCNGDSSQYYDCTFGSSAITLVGAIVRPTVLLTRETITGKVARDVSFKGCQFWRKATNSANAFVWATGATDVERKMEFEDCLFYNDVTATATPAVAVGGAAVLTTGRIIFSGSTREIGCTALATQTGTWSCLPEYAAAGGSGIQAT